MLFVLTPLFVTDTQALSTSARAFVLMDADTGIVLAGENQHEKLKMASTTKIMTTLLALEKAQKTDSVVTFTEDMVAEGSSMYLAVGDKLHLSDLASGMMMASGNDAANAAALFIGKSFEGFAKLMNKRAEEIGMVDSSFVTPSGLDDENHYSTAYDMALLMKEALKNQSFAELTASTEKTVEFVYPEKSTTYPNHNRLLKLYPYCTGGKTGYTDAAGRCLVSSAEKDGVRLVAVTLSAPDDWNDHQALYDYGFSLYTNVNPDEADRNFEVKLSGAEQEFLKAKAEDLPILRVPQDRVEDIEKKIYLPTFIFAPVNKGDRVGKIIYILDGKELASADIKALESVKEKHQPNFFEWLFSAIFNKE